MRNLVLVLIGVMSASAAFALEPECPRDFRDGAAPLTCFCPSAAMQAGDVWGDGVYTADSALCVAARHAGAAPVDGGTVTVLPEPGRDLYSGTVRNGVTTFEYGTYGASFRFDGISLADHPSCPATLRNKGGVSTLNCLCSAAQTETGDVWGSNPYTSDSAVCRAARHAGVIAAEGGLVTARVSDGRPGYRGSWSNGVMSRAYDAYDASFVIEGAEPVAYGTLCPDRFTGFAAEPDPLDCLCTGEATQKGDAWGDLDYTSDSTICRAALHAGAVGPLGGQVIVTRQAGRDRYSGSTRNGVVTTERGPSAFGFTVSSAEPLTTEPVQAPLAESLATTGEAQLYISFRSGSAELDGTADAVLQDLASLLQTTPQLRLDLIGHTDSQGAEEANLRLSERRAQAVRSWLEGHGISPDRLAAQGRGEAEPLAPNETEEGRALNRRVQVVRR